MFPVVLLGNPENRRVELFQAALLNRSLPPAHVVSWIDFLNDPRTLANLPDVPTFVRIESFGENAAVEHALLCAGADDAAHAGVTHVSVKALETRSVAHGEILAPRQMHLGFLRALRTLETVLQEKKHWQVFPSLDTIRTLFDKRQTSLQYETAGIPVPRALRTVSSVEELRDQMEQENLRSVYVKLSCASSASCLAVYFRGESPDDDVVMSTMQSVDDRFFNSLKICRYQQPKRIRTVLSFLLREGSQIEVSVPKATVEKRFFDCRVLVIDRVPAFVVVRKSPHPITNLHLGGQRGDFAEVRKVIAEEQLDAAFESTVRVFDQHQALHVGVDLLFESNRRDHRIVEANAFGDLLPRLTNNGLSVYEWQIETLRRKALER